MAKKQVSNASRLIVIGGSSGSLDALLIILPELIKDFKIPVLIVLHRNNSADNGLTDLLASKTSMPVKEADEKELLRPGRIYLAPADYHILTEDDGSVSLDISEKVHYCRPSIDVTLASAATAYKENLTAILLSGANADGACGMGVVKEYGGRNIVQDPGEALVSYMPAQAILLTVVDDILPAAEIGRLMNQLAKEPGA